MSNERQINPALRNVDLIIDEQHWLGLTALAAKKGVVIDTLVGAIFEHFLIKLEEIVPGERDNPVRADVQLEPVRDDKQFYNALLTERETMQEDRKIAATITDEDTYKFDWHGI